MARIPVIEPSGRQLGVSQVGQQIDQTAPLRGVADVVQGVADVTKMVQARDAETAVAKNFSDMQINLANKEREMQIKMQENPDQFTSKWLEAADKEYNQMLGRMSDNPYYREAFSQRWNQYRPQLANKALSFESSRREAIQAARLEQAGTNLYNLTYGDPSQYQTALMQIEGNMAMAKETGLVPNAEAALQKQKDSIGYALFRGALDREDYATAQQAISPDILGEYFDNANQEYLRAQESQKSKARVQINRAVNDVSAALDSEIPVDATVFESLKQSATDVGDDEALEQIMALMDLQTEVVEAKSKTVQELAQDIEIERDKIGAGDFDRMANLQAKGKILQQRTKAIEGGEFLEYLERNGTLPETGIADISQPEQFGQVLEARRAAYLTIAEKEGVEINVLKKVERDALKKSFDSANSQQAAAMLNTLSQLVNKDEMPILASQFMPTSKEYSAAFSLAADAPVDALKIIEGAKRPLPADVKRGELSQAIRDKIGGIVRDAQGTNEAVAASEAYYKQRHFEAQAQGGIDDELLDEAVEKVLGKPIEMGGSNSRVFSFRIDGDRYADESTVNDLVEDLDETVLMEVFGDVPRGLNNNPVDIGLIKNDAQFFTVGEGIYQVGYYDSQTGQVEPFVDGDGQPYEIDMKRVYDHMQVTSNPVLESIKARQMYGLRRSQDRSSYKAEYERVLSATGDRKRAKAAADEMLKVRRDIRMGNEQ